MGMYEYIAQPLWAVFLEWAGKMMVEKKMCTNPSLKGCHCYPSASNRKCRDCFEKYMEGKEC